MPVQSGVIEAWVVYSNPKDYPGKYVVRHWAGLIPDRHALAVEDTLESARKKIPPGRYCLPRAPKDDDAVIEVWL